MRKILICSPSEYQELQKAKYTKRWKGKDGKWRYKYATDTQHPRPWSKESREADKQWDAEMAQFEKEEAEKYLLEAISDEPYYSSKDRPLAVKVYDDYASGHTRKDAKKIIAHSRKSAARSKMSEKDKKQSVRDVAESLDQAFTRKELNKMDTGELHHFIVDYPNKGDEIHTYAKKLRAKKKKKTAKLVSNFQKQAKDFRRRAGIPEGYTGPA